jgi:hypothetical protein
VYGTRAHTAAELAGRLSDRSGLVFEEHDSDFRGRYFVAETAFGRVEAQPNAIPGDDGQDDLYDDAHPDVRTLLLITGTIANTLDAALDSIDGLILLEPPSGLVDS